MNINYEKLNNSLHISFKDYEKNKCFSWHELINELIVIDKLYPKNKVVNYSIGGWCESTYYSVTNQDSLYETHVTGSSLNSVIDGMKRLWEHSGYLNIVVTTVNIDLLIDD